jgi:hypothetical protein
MEKAIATSDPNELEIVIAELREGLAEHIQRIRKMAASKLPSIRHRKTDETL